MVEQSMYSFLYRHYSDSPADGAIVLLTDEERRNSRFTLNNLEGVFVSQGPFDLVKPLRAKNPPICRRDQMKDFEKKYNGKFVPFDHPDYTAKLLSQIP